MEKTGSDHSGDAHDLFEEKLMRPMAAMERGGTSKRSPNLDYISSMPDPILQHILSFLETREAVQTCILAKRWTDLWTSLTSLSFNISSFMRVDKWTPIGLHREKEREEYKLRMKKKDETVFTHFVDMVLERRQPYDLQRFHLNYRDAELAMTYDYVYKWVKYAMRHNVGDLDLSSSNRDSVLLCFTDCSSLEQLHVKIYQDDLGAEPVTERINLPNLRELHLTGVILDDYLSNPLFSNCPALEDLCMENCAFFHYHLSSTNLKRLKIIFVDCFWYNCIGHEDFVVRISAPNLTSFCFVGLPELFQNTTFENTFSLVHMHIEFDQFSYIDKGPYDSSSEVDQDRWRYSWKPWKSFFAIYSVKDLELRGKCCVVCYILFNL